MKLNIYNQKSHLKIYRIQVYKRISIFNSHYNYLILLHYRKFWFTNRWNILYI